MTLSRSWAGRAYGTNVGNLFLSLDGDEAELTGTLRFNETGVGLAIYEVTGAFSDTLSLRGKRPENAELPSSDFLAEATLNSRGELEGEWETTEGFAGTFLLFPHDKSRGVDSSEDTPAQLHTARYRLGAVEINRVQVEQLATDIQTSFQSSNVVVTVVAGTEQSRFLDDFRKLHLEADKAEILKIFAQEAGGRGVIKGISVEFGPRMNELVVQGPDEAWVLGKLEELKRRLKRCERSYATHFKRIGVGFNQVVFAATIVYLASIEDLLKRFVFFAGVCILLWGFSALHRKFLPFATIHLGERPKPLLARISSPFWSWTMALIVAVAASVLAGILEGWLLTSLGKNE